MVNKTMSTKISSGQNRIKESASAQFALPYWSAGYFAVREDGQLVCRPDASSDIELALTELAQSAADAGLHLPLLMRFPDILSDRVKCLCGAFDKAREQRGYKSPYTLVYPIKVNQQRCVVEQIVQALPGRVGLEAGSKPELMAVLAQSFCKSTAEDFETIICNGYKDREYTRLALIGAKLGKRIFIVIEQVDELKLVLEQAEALDVLPRLGVRLRLASIAKGKWQNSGGEKSKFGLSAAQLLQLVASLKALHKLEALQLLHVHVGSQVADINDLRSAMREAARYYQELHKLGVNISVFDVGGGLAVDYQGAQSTSEFSMNYSVQQYADVVVESLAEVCQRTSLPQPEIITESGRALTAHHAVLISNVLGVEYINSELPLIKIEHALVDQLNMLIERVMQSESADTLVNLLEYCDQCIIHIHENYLTEELSLPQRGALESLAMHCQKLIAKQLKTIEPKHIVLAQLNARLGDKYICNFSLFQSLPDAWGLQQAFPVLPLQRLNEPFDRRAIVHDLTCDSDGQISDYPQQEGLMPTLPAHTLQEGEHYLMGVFMVGAYQEILGDMHNLFGDTNSINVLVTRDGDYRLEGAEPGDRIDQLLEYVHYDIPRLLSQYKLKLERTKLSEAVKHQYYLELAAGLSGYTYLED